MIAAPDHREELEREARRAEMSGDPLAPVLHALAGTTRAMDRSMAEISRQINQNHQPSSKEIVRQEVGEAVRSATAEMLRTLNIRTIVAAVALVLLLMVGSFGAGYWARGDRLMIAGLHEACKPQNGGVLCYIPVWQTLPNSTAGK